MARRQQLHHQRILPASSLIAPCSKLTLAWCNRCCLKLCLSIALAACPCLCSVAFEHAQLHCAPPLLVHLTKGMLLCLGGVSRQCDLPLQAGQGTVRCIASTSRTAVAMPMNTPCQGSACFGQYLPLRRGRVPPALPPR